MSTPDVETDARGEVSDAEQTASRFQWTWPAVIAIALSIGVLGAAIGFSIGRNQARPGRVDVGFAQDMIDHHDQAVRMALTTLGRGADPEVEGFAREIILFQRWEIGIMDAWLQDWGELRGDLDRSAMTWMSMGSAVGDMPGMATQAQLDQLARAEGQQLNRLFLTLMREHHLGGVHMAESAARDASTAKVRDLANRMARNQLMEVDEYTRSLRRLGLEGGAP